MMRHLGKVAKGREQADAGQAGLAERLQWLAAANVTYLNMTDKTEVVCKNYRQELFISGIILNSNSSCMEAPQC